MTFSIRHGLVLALLSSLGISSTGEDGGGESGLFIESDICGPLFANCADSSRCFDHTAGCLEDGGNVTLVDCEEAFGTCRTCFPNSRCGSTEAAPIDESAMFIESDICGLEAVARCSGSGRCFDHNLGTCFEDGSVIEDCQPALPCGPCFPNSRCGSTEAPPIDESAMFIESDICGLDFAGCSVSFRCFDHNLGTCLEDGSVIEDCQEALLCRPCFPNSRCGSTEALPVDESAMFVESDTCVPALAACAQARNCFDHTVGCEEDGSMSIEECQMAPACASCFPNSRCGSLEEAEATAAPVATTAEPVKATAAPVGEEMEGTSDDEASAAGIRSQAMVLPGILALVAGISW